MAKTLSVAGNLGPWEFFRNVIYLSFLSPDLVNHKLQALKLGIYTQVFSTLLWSDHLQIKDLETEAVEFFQSHKESVAVLRWVEFW